MIFESAIINASLDFIKRNTIMTKFEKVKTASTIFFSQALFSPFFHKLTLTYSSEVSPLQSFPTPLSAKEEEYYLRLHEKGDKDARRILIERNLRLVAYLVKKYSSSDFPQEDLISIGTIGLIKAVDSYQSGKGVRLATYASRCIDNELLMTFRSAKKQAKEVYLYEPINGEDSDGNSLQLLDLLETNDEDVAERLEFEENAKKIYRYLDTVLTQREREIIRMRYGLPREYQSQEKVEITQREIAKQYGISRSYVSRIEKKALEKLREAYKNDKSKT